jgi:hypothetical protein
VGTATEAGFAKVSPAGIGSTFGAGSVSTTGTAKATPVGVQASGAVGTCALKIIIFPAGLASTAALGTVSKSAGAVEGVAGVSDIGVVGVLTEEGDAYINPAGVSGTWSCPTQFGANGTASCVASGTVGHSAVGACSFRCDCYYTLPTGTQGRLDVGFAWPTFPLPGVEGVSDNGQVIANMIVLNPWTVWLGNTV